MPLLKSISLIIFLLLPFLSFTQDDTCDCNADLAYLHSKVKKTKAYKQNKEAYKKAYDQAAKKAASIHTIYPCHQLLNRLILSINDNHSRIYGLDKGATKTIRENEGKLDSFKTTSFFQIYPKWEIDLDSLEHHLESYPLSEVEGIYNYDTLFKIAIFKYGGEDFYHSVILESKSTLWERGEESHTLVPFGKDYFLAIGGNLSSKRLLTYTERLENGSFQFLRFSKRPAPTKKSRQTLSDDTYFREEISEDITYIRLGSFSSWYPTLGEAEEFYKSLKGNLNKKHLIVDLRGNTGGGDRNSDIIFKILKKYAKKNKIYVLTNFRTMSNGEQFTLRLRKFDRYTHLGQRTNGCLAYEIKDSSYELPSGHFIAVLTKNKFKQYLAYESQGIEPNIALGQDEDWIQAIQDLINNQ